MPPIDPKIVAELDESGSRWASTEKSERSNVVVTLGAAADAPNKRRTQHERPLWVRNPRLGGLRRRRAGAR